ncbi:MAG TPA: SDR family oxidoreductase, partial [Nannocystis sp.]
AGGRVDLLVNNAASFEHGRLMARSDADLRRVLEVNLVAPVSLARALAPALTAAGGAVVNILDVAAVQPWRGYLDHCTAKAGLAMATRALAVELAPAVRVNGVAPGTVAWPEDDPRYAAGSAVRERILRAIPLGRIGRPEDVAEAVLFLASSSFITGQVLAVDGGRLAGGGAEGG